MQVDPLQLTWLLFLHVDVDAQSFLEGNQQEFMKTFACFTLPSSVKNSFLSLNLLRKQTMRMTVRETVTGLQLLRSSGVEKPLISECL